VNADLIAWVFGASAGMPELDQRLLAVLAQRSDPTGEGGCLTVGALQVILGCQAQDASDALGRLMEAGLLSVSLWTPTHLESWRLLAPSGPVPQAPPEPAAGGGA
jgi:hypothetical protein